MGGNSFSLWGPRTLQLGQLIARIEARISLVDALFDLLQCFDPLSLAILGV
jgi:hypothetical protein